MNTRKLLLVFLLVFIAKQDLQAQFGFSHEIGVITGPVAFYSDFGQRYDFETNAGNVGFGIGIIHYMNFSYRADCNCYTRDRYFNVLIERNGLYFLILNDNCSQRGSLSSRSQFFMKPRTISRMMSVSKLICRL